MQVQHYTEEQYLYDDSLAYLTGVVTFPAKVREIHNPPSGAGRWRVRAAIVSAYRDGAEVGRVVLEGSPSEEQLAEARSRMELAVLEAIAAEVQA